MKNDVIAYTVNKAINGNMYISVQNGEVVVRAPWYLSKEQIQEMIDEKKKWIVAKLKEYEQISDSKSQLVSCNRFKILGRNYDLKIFYKNVKIPNLTVESNYVINVFLPKKYRKLDNKQIIDELVGKMYKVIAERELDSIMEKTRIMLGLAPEDYEIKKMKNRLGYCTEEKKIIINPEIVMYERSVIEYIVLHEFCHLKYKNHVKSFYQMVERYMPNYKKYADIISNIQY